MTATQLRLVVTFLGIMCICVSLYVVGECYGHAEAPDFRWPVIGCALFAAAMNLAGVWALWRWK